MHGVLWIRTPCSKVLSWENGEVDGTVTNEQHNEAEIVSALRRIV